MCRSVNVNHGWFDSDTAPPIERSTDFAVLTKRGDCLASIELGVRHDPNLRFIPWQDIIAKAPEATRNLPNPFELPVSISHAFCKSEEPRRADIKIVPDAVFGLEYTTQGHKTYCFFALDADRNTTVARSNLRQTSYLKKILGYRAIVSQSIYRSHHGLPNLLVLNVITNEHHMKSVMSLLDEVTEKKGSPMFLLKTLSTLGDFRTAPAPSTHILTAPWRRAGCDDFYINTR